MSIKLGILLFLALHFAIVGKGQNSNACSVVIKYASNDWKKDSSSCLGLRQKHFESLRHSVVDSVNKDFLISNLGIPNRVQKFYQGGKNFVGYIYYIYKDKCPK